MFCPCQKDDEQIIPPGMCEACEACEAAVPAAVPAVPDTLDPSLLQTQRLRRRKHHQSIVDEQKEKHRNTTFSIHSRHVPYCAIPKLLRLPEQCTKYHKCTLTHWICALNSPCITLQFLLAACFFPKKAAFVAENPWPSHPHLPVYQVSAMRLRSNPNETWPGRGSAGRHAPPAISRSSIKWLRRAGIYYDLIMTGKSNLAFAWCAISSCAIQSLTLKVAQNLKYPPLKVDTLTTVKANVTRSDGLPTSGDPWKQVL